MLTFDPVPWVAVVSVAGNVDLVIGVLYMAVSQGEWVCPGPPRPRKPTASTSPSPPSCKIDELSRSLSIQRNSHHALGCPGKRPHSAPGIDPK